MTMCKYVELLETAIEGRESLFPLPCLFFLNICRMSLVCQLGDMVVNPDSFIAEITNRPKDTVNFFLWFSIQALWFYGSELWLPP